MTIKRKNRRVVKDIAFMTEAIQAILLEYESVDIHTDNAHVMRAIEEAAVAVKPPAQVQPHLISTDRIVRISRRKF